MYSRRAIVAYVLAVVSVIGLTLIQLPLRDLFTIANVTMVFLLLVVIMAVTRGTGPAFVTAFASFVSINYFFVQPLHTLLVADPREVLDLIVFLVVAAIAGRLGARARQQARTAQQRAHEQSILYALTRALNQLTSETEIYATLTRLMCDDLGAVKADLLPFTTEAAADDLTTHYLLLQTSEHVYGTLRVAFRSSLEEPRLDLLNTCAVQAAMALQRIELAERARKSQQFEEADRLKTALLHAVSHDLRTPITIIKTSASNLRQFGDTLPATERVEIAETIESEADQLDRLVGNLLDMSRLKAGALRLSTGLNSLEEVAGDVAARAWQLHKQERVKIVFPDDMPLVNFDYGLLLQALTNLVDNSIRYEPPESAVEIRGEVAGKEILLKVVNHGETISPEMKVQIMEPFYRGREGRIGLGLPIAQGIIEAHHGKLRIEDTPGGGATFVIVLPAQEKKYLETQDSGG
ncbi:MAG: DUF4118 domain-containing protein [Anaerolineae bacterium]|nr:DUF4118 domain-containing protein [Anaerolineae bacterium]